LLPIRVFPDTMEVVEAVCKRSWILTVEEKLGLFFLFQIIINLFLSFNCSNNNHHDNVNVGGGVEGQASSSSGEDCDRLQDMR
jgi:hypothetical protein